ncbi:serine/threonine-protein kinase BIK1 [Jatropha curcas]|uniref:serine/threonine-protein kinase BIK1 n=1 Tax=Jatropha curcas TaxID=180498 RepID=UPI001894E167|nr:serine/threonine-protein kinase BIK1 [Jatropha curcas]
MHAENPPYMPCLIRNIHAAHILLNEDYKPVLIDYSMLSGGILTDRRHIVNQYLEGCHGYVDPVVAHRGEWSDKSDVFSYGVLLLALISKRIPEEESELTENKHKPQNSMMSFSEHKSSVVHQSLEFEPYFYSSDGVKVAKLAIKCMQYHPQKRPTMKQVVRYLQNLCIVRRHSNELNIHKILGDDEIVLRTDNRSEKESKLIPAWRWEYFSKSINLKRLSYRDKGGPNHGPAGKWKMFLCPKVQFSK